MTFNPNRHLYEARNQNKATGPGTGSAVGKVFSLYKPTRSSKEPSKGRASNGYESPSSAAWAPILKDNQQQTRNQGGNAAKSGEKNRTPSKYQPLTDLNEMRTMRDQARRIKNNSQYASSTPQQIVASVPGGKVMMQHGFQNTGSSKYIEIKQPFASVL
jgi:hypothetical protein